MLIIYKFCWSYCTLLKHVMSCAIYIVLSVRQEKEQPSSCVTELSYFLYSIRTQKPLVGMQEKSPILKVFLGMMKLSKQLPTGNSCT